MKNIQGPPPIKYPTVLVGGVSYSLKLGSGAVYRLEDQGIDLAQLEGIPRKFQAVFKMLAAMLGTEESDEWIPIQLTPERIADNLHPDELLTLHEKLTEAMEKAQLPGMKQKKKPPTPEADQNPVDAITG